MVSESAGDEELDDEELPEEMKAMLEDMENLPPQQKRIVQNKVVRETFAMMGIGRMSRESEVAKKKLTKHTLVNIWMAPVNRCATTIRSATKEKFIRPF